MSDIAQRLKEMRDRASYSQEAFADDGISQRKVSYWESGQIPDALNVLAILAQRYQCSADYLLGLTDDPAPSGESSAIQKIFNRLSADRQADLLEMAEVWLMDESDEYRLELFTQMMDENADDPEFVAQVRRWVDEALAGEGGDEE